MLSPILILGIHYFLRFLSFLILIRVILSWLAPNWSNAFTHFVVQTTEQILVPIREKLPRGEGTLSMIDWSPLVALFLIDLIRYLLIALVQGF